MEAHERAVQAVAERVKFFHANRKPFRVYHGSTNSTRKSQYSLSNTVDISALKNVLQIDVQRKTALIEPNVPMDRLLEATLACGLVPPVVMEFPGITVGGGFSGTSGESSSFRYGSFDQSAVSVEMVLGDGTIVVASLDQHKDLFLGAASAFGTLGIVTLVKLRLLDAQPYVAVTYYPISGIEQALNMFKRFQNDESIDYLDGILLSKDSGVVVTGRLTSERGGYRSQGFTAPTDPWFYIHAEKTIQKETPVTELTPITDYLFRFDRGGFWVAKYAFQYFLTPFNFITRRLLDRFMHTRVMYHALHRSGFAELYVVQDVAVPYPTASKFVEYLDKNFGCYPLWLCPLLLKGTSPMFPRSTTSQSGSDNDPTLPLLNFGVWGPAPAKGRDAFVEFNRDLERQVYQLGGKKWLYAHAYYTKKEFQQIYDMEAYNALRQKYSADHLPSIYDKVKVDVAAERKAINESWAAWLLALFWSIWPLAGVYGVLHTLIHTDYLIRKPKRWFPVYKAE